MRLWAALMQELTYTALRYQEGLSLSMALYSYVTCKAEKFNHVPNLEEMKIQQFEIEVKLNRAAR